jgi:hypothetical protein
VVRKNDGIGSVGFTFLEKSHDINIGNRYLGEKY